MRMILVMARTKNWRSRFRERLALTVLLLVLPAPGPAQEADRISLSAPARYAPHTDVDLRPGPQPPCGKEPIPPYPGLDDAATVMSWSEREFGRDWRPPVCTGWSTVGFTTLITIVARFRHAAQAEGLLRHVGAISGLTGMRYWSTTHKQWRTLILDASALTDLQRGQRREDFTSNEMKEGKDLYFEQTDNLSGKVVYRMHIAEASADRLVFEIENVSTVRHLLIPVLHPGEMQSIYFLDRESDDVWGYYSIVRTGKSANGLITGNEASTVNRAVAFYRYMARIPTDQEPPAAR
jgi:hypothetical protein